MAYVELVQIKGRIPDAFLTQALDDDSDGVIDAWEQVQADACAAVDAILGLRFAVPITGSPIPAVVTEAARAWACYECYRRRSVSDDVNPRKSEYDVYFHATNGLLMKIAMNKAPLAPGAVQAPAVAKVISECAGTFDHSHRRLT